ncbi:MAG: Ldh family oxidoreductase, partial [Planctomycetales bacterium]|nr:Ldh family oxidoreductase [Planctomycetales bacterium]NIN07170.1 Ldh family oxidoreductase [Planctomycetales bacterium]NIP03348.1 Ldh family oxidoreductase [Planctomycetales bacterium]
MSEKGRIVPANALQAYLTRLFARTRMSQAHAAHCSTALVQTNLWGIDSHGVLRAPLYLERLESGAVNATPQISLARGGLALEVLDGDDGMGFVVGQAAMQRAIELAEQYNVGAVGAVRSNHFGAAALYAHMATQRGMIGLVMTNVIPNMVAPGGSRPITGNNPIAIGIPTFADFPFMLDISLSTVAGGKLLLASKR